MKGDQMGVWQRERERKEGREEGGIGGVCKGEDRFGREGKLEGREDEGETN